MKPTPQVLEDDDECKSNLKLSKILIIGLSELKDFFWGFNLFRKLEFFYCNVNFGQKLLSYLQRYLKKKEGQFL